MQTVVGIVMMIIGFFMSIFSGTVIHSDLIRHRYSYSPPFTDHETAMMILIFIGIIVILTGIGLIIASIVSQRSKDKINRLQNIGADGLSKSCCIKCGLNLTPNATKCPRCGNIIEKENNNAKN